MTPLYIPYHTYPGGNIPGCLGNTIPPVTIK